MLALNTGIAPSAWAAEDERTIVTAMRILMDAQHDDSKPTPIAEG